MDPILKLLGIDPPKFHAGDAVVFIDPVITHETSPEVFYRPNMSTIYTVRDVGLRKRKWHLRLVGDIDLVFEEIHFAPAELLPAAELAELLAEVLDPVPA